MIEKIFSFVSGLIFGIGLVISGMTNPEKVIGFLNLTHNWDASLIFVMGGAIIIFAPFFYLLRNNKETFLGSKIELSKKIEIDKKLIFGASLFGIGWGLVGFCPGPAIVSLVFFEPVSVIFLISMMFGIMLNKKF